MHRPTQERCNFQASKPNLLCEARLYELDQPIYCKLLVRAVRDDPDGSAAHDSERKHTEQALGIDTALLLLNPDRGFVLIRFLNEEGCRACVKANLVLDRNIAILSLF